MKLETPSTYKGTPAPDFTLKATDGQWYRLSDIQGENGTMIMFICNHCPYVRGVIDRLVADMTELESYGIGIAAIMPNDTVTYPEDSFENMGVFAAQNQFSFPYLFDETQEVARQYQAVCTPDFFGYDRTLHLQYRGRLDSAGISASTTDRRRELVEAMIQVAHSGTSPSDQYPSIGCSIKWR